MKTHHWMNAKRKAQSEGIVFRHDGQEPLFMRDMDRWRELLNDPSALTEQWAAEDALHDAAFDQANARKVSK